MGRLGVGRSGTGVWWDSSLERSRAGVRRREARQGEFRGGSPAWGGPRLEVRRGEARGRTLLEVSVAGRPGTPGGRRMVRPGTGSRESVSARWSRRRAPGQWG